MDYAQLKKRLGGVVTAAKEGSLAGVCRTDRFSFGVDVGVRDRVRVLDWQQDAHSVEGRVGT